MKKVKFLLVALFMALCFTSCKTVENYSLIYDVNVTGSSDGLVNVTFPNGELDLNGTADLGFVFSNDTVKSINPNEALQANTLLSSPEQNDALLYEVSWVDANFDATSAEGHYDLLIDGFVKEPITGVTLSVHKRLTNKE